MKSSRNFIAHIGFGKTSTTTLQSQIFPLIANKKKLKYISSDILIRDLKLDLKNLDFHPFEKLETNKNLKKIKNAFLSYESLLGFSWDPKYFEKTCQLNREILGKDAHILIIIRKPSEILNSIYLQQIQTNRIIKPNSFFYSDKIFEKEKNFFKSKLNIKYFDYDQLVKIYRSNFEKVTIVKYEEIKKFSFLNELFATETSLKNLLTQKYQFAKKNRSYNRSYSATALYLTFKLNSFLTIFNFNLFRYERFLSKYISHKKKSMFTRIINRILYELSWRNFIQNRFDRIYPYKKYKVNFEKIGLKEVSLLDHRYEKMKGIMTYNMSQN